MGFLCLGCSSALRLHGRGHRPCSPFLRSHSLLHRLSSVVSTTPPEYFPGIFERLNVPSGSAKLGSVNVSSRHWSVTRTFKIHTLSRFRHHLRCLLARGLSREVHVLLNTRCHRSPLCESLPEFMRVALPESPFHTTHHGTRRRTKTHNQVAREHKKKRMTMMMK